MADRVDDLTKLAIRKAYVAREGTMAAIAKRFGVSVGTIKRLKKDAKENNGDWDALRDGRTLAVRDAVQALGDRPQSPIDVSGIVVDTDMILKLAIQGLQDDLRDANVKSRSKEAVVTALVRVVELYRKYHPPTVDELIDLAIAIPGFDVREFARRLKERIDQKAS